MEDISSMKVFDEWGFTGNEYENFPLQKRKIYFQPWGVLDLPFHGDCQASNTMQLFKNQVMLF